jgi:hypothetical protein
VFIVIAALTLGGALVVAAGFALYSARDPNSQVFQKDFTTSGDVARVDEPGLSWDESGGTLNLYPAANSPQQLDFEIPASQAAKVIATVTQPAYAGSPETMWGVTIESAQHDTGVALTCSPGRPPSLYDLNSGELLSFGSGTCEETMEMTLKVTGNVIVGETNTGASMVYSGPVAYSDLDHVAVLIYSEQPDQVLRVSEISAYVP